MSEAENVVIRIDNEAKSGTSSTEDLLMVAEMLLKDMIFVSDLLPPNDSEHLIKAISDVYLWLDDSRQGRLRGRPRIDISEAQLAMLLSFQFSAADIGCMLQVTVSTVRRRILLFGLEQFTDFSPCTDAELDVIIMEFAHNHPNGGQKVTKAFCEEEVYMFKGTVYRAAC